MHNIRLGFLQKEALFCIGQYSIHSRAGRQVGKPYAVRHLSKSFDSFVEVNFEEEMDVRMLFDGSLNPAAIVRKLSNYYGVGIVEGQTLLFLDEIQACPDALRSLRFFHEKMPSLHVIACGSLLEFALESIPSHGVGRITSLFMFPRNFVPPAIRAIRGKSTTGIERRGIATPRWTT